MNNSKINFLEACFLIVIVTITHVVLNLPNTLIESMGSASSLNVIYITVIALLLFKVINKFFSAFDEHNLVYVAGYLGGKLLKIVLVIVYVLYFIFISGILLRNFAEVLKIIYFPQAHIWAVLLLFILVGLIVNSMGLKNVVKVNAILVIPILLTIVITAFSLHNKFDYGRLFPIVGYGVKNTFLSGSLNIFALNGIVYLYLIKPYLNNSKDYAKVGYVSIIISGLYIFLVVSALLMLFPYITSGNQTLSVYLATRVVEYGKFMQRTDAVYMFVWIFDFMSYLSVIIAFISELSNDFSKRKNNYIILIVVSVLVFIVAILPANTTQLRFFESTVYKYLSIGIVFVLSFVILLFGYLKKIKSLKKGLTENAIS